MDLMLINPQTGVCNKVLLSSDQSSCSHTQTLIIVLVNSGFKILLEFQHSPCASSLVWAAHRVPAG